MTRECSPGSETSHTADGEGPDAPTVRRRGPAYASRWRLGAFALVAALSACAPPAKLNAEAGSDARDRPASSVVEPGAALSNGFNENSSSRLNRQAEDAASAGTLPPGLKPALLAPREGEAAEQARLSLDEIVHRLRTQVDWRLPDPPPLAVADGDDPTTAPAQGRQAEAPLNAEGDRKAVEAKGAEGASPSGTGEPTRAAADAAAEGSAEQAGEMAAGGQPSDARTERSIPLAAQRSYIQGRQRLREGRRQLHEAIRKLDAALRLAPNQPRILRLLAGAYATLGNRARAANYLERALSAEPTDLKAAMLLGRVEFEQGRWRRATLALHHVLTLLERPAPAQRRDPVTEPLARFYLANALERQGYDLEAARQFERALDVPETLGQSTAMAREFYLLQRQRGLSWQSLGDARSRLGQFERALEAYRRAREAAVPDPAPLILRTIHAAFRLERPEVALDAYLELLRHEPEDERLKPLTTYLVRQGVDRQRLAEEVHELYQTLDQPVTLALLYADLRGGVEARRLLETHLAENPRDRQVFDRLVARWLDEGREHGVEDAMRLLAVAADRAPEAADVYAGVILERVDDPARILNAIDALDEPLQETATILLIRGLALGDSGKVLQAKQTLRRAMEKGAEPARLALTRMALARGDLDEARRLLQPLEGRTEPNITELRVRVLQRAGEFEKAIELLDRMIAENPRSAQLVLRKAELQIARREFVQAEQTLRDGLNRMPEAEPLYETLFELYDNNLVPDSVRQYQRLMARLLGQMPESRIARLKQAEIYEARRDYGKAESLLRGLLERNAIDPRASDLLLEVLVEAGKQAEADAFASGLIEDFEDRPRMLMVALRHYRERSPDPEQVDRVLERLLRAQPASAERDAQLAALLLRTGRAEQALRLAEKRLAASPDDPAGSAAIIAEALVQLDRVDELDRRFEAWVERFPDHEADLRFEHARIVERHVDRERGERMMWELVQDFPNHATANNNLGYAWTVRGHRLEEAEKMIRRAVDREPDNAAFIDSLGWVLYKRGRFDEAVRMLTRAREAEGGRNPVILDHLGDALYRAGRKDEAVKRWGEARRLYERLGPTARQFDPELEGLGERLRAKRQAVRSGKEPPVAESPGAEGSSEREAPAAAPA